MPFHAKHLNDALYLNWSQYIKDALGQLRVLTTDHCMGWHPCQMASLVVIYALPGTILTQELIVALLTV